MTDNRDKSSNHVFFFLLQEWQPFPKRWYNEGLLVTNTILKDDGGVRPSLDIRAFLLNALQKGHFQLYLSFRAK